MEPNTRLPYFLRKIQPELESRGYTLERQLSEPGSHGPSGSVVWLARRNGRQEALKISAYGLLDNYEGDNLGKVDDFAERERKVLEQAGSHPSIPDYYEGFEIGYDETEKAHVIAMQYLDMPTVAQRITQRKSFSELEAIMLLQSGLSAEGHLHSLGIVHRDIKPENVHLNHKRAYISDFDVVKIGNGTSTTNLMNPYYPIDFISEENQNPGQDLVALGNVAIAGAFGKTIGEIRFEQKKYGLESVNVKELPYSRKMRKFLKKLTADSKHRYQTASAALRDLKKLSGKSVAVAGRKNSGLEHIAEGEPTSWEVAKELAKDTFGLNALINYSKNIGKFAVGTVDFSKGFFPVLGYTILASQFIPTAIRQKIEKKSIWKHYDINDDSAYGYGQFMGSGFGIATDFVLGLSSLHLFDNHHQEMFLTWLGANTLSGAYELSRHKYKKTKERLEAERKERIKEEESRRFHEYYEERRKIK
jgi:hypothetical protein